MPSVCPKADGAAAGKLLQWPSVKTNRSMAPRRVRRWAPGLLSPPLGLPRRPLSCPVLCAAFPLAPRPSGSSLPHQSTLPFRFQPTVLSSGKSALGHPAAPPPLGEAPLKALGAQDTSLLALAAASYVCVMLSRACTSHEGKDHVPGLAVPRTHPLPCKAQAQPDLLRPSKHSAHGNPKSSVLGQTLGTLRKDNLWPRSPTTN